MRDVYTGARDPWAPAIVVFLGAFFAFAILLVELWPVPQPPPPHNPNLIRVEAPPRMERTGP